MTTKTITPATLAAHLESKGFRAQRAGMTFVKAVGRALDHLTPAERGQRMVDAFLAALDEPRTNFDFNERGASIDNDVDLGQRAAAKIIG